MSDTKFDAVAEAVAGALGEALDCTRVWSAWSAGTMSDDDFSRVADDSDRVSEIANAAIDAMAYAPLTDAEIKDLTAMIWGAPAGSEWLDQVAIPFVRQFEELRATGKRPVDPAKAGVPSGSGSEA